MLKLRCVVVSAVAVLFLAVPAAQAAPTRSAQRFADAVKRGKIAISHARPLVRQAIEDVEFDRCFAVLKQGKLPRRVQERTVYVVGLAVTTPFSVPTMPILDRLVADLDLIPTADPALRAGREAWRQNVALMKRIPVLDHPCAQLEAWKASGWAPAKAPALNLAATRALFKELDDTDRYDRALKRAVKRLRQLGVSRKDAQRFSGDTLYDGLLSDSAAEDLFDVLVEDGRAEAFGAAL